MELGDATLEFVVDFKFISDTSLTGKTNDLNVLNLIIVVNLRPTAHRGC